MFTYKVSNEVSLRLLEEQDAEELFQLTDHSRAHLMEWLPWLDAIRAPSDSLSFIEQARKKFENNEGMDVGIIYHGQIVGIVGFHYFDYTNRKTSIGYWLGEPFQGKGIMTDTCRAMIEYAFITLDMNRIEIRCATQNERSNAIPKRLGFNYEGTARQSEWLYDHYVDHDFYGLLKSEWETIT
ncbi:GCN5 family acetyltransferase [Pontibacillus halophilus JSM 076056 = DSM 19796]|uniref:GCN5 family acetyltransferase n=1 Tax=Pontibacillus halophilus JSM 076056 = DSM 19796 TaxID=1385510 RepID=A0A0A5IAU0_9BACI|nr:GNAT family protein [Pontibacillus halophilus]KGX92947.1 GCN5 family acetyltransferase [Pontibacillus halophilus JSM 076056 = DSM 19796]